MTCSILVNLEPTGAPILVLSIAKKSIVVIYCQGPPGLAGQDGVFSGDLVSMTSLSSHNYVIGSSLCLRMVILTI